MSQPRFHLPASQWSSPQLSLLDEEAIHCARVMRKQPGDHVEIFDGEGRVAECRITRVAKNAVHAEIVAESRARAFETAIHLCPALIKAEPFEWLLEKAVELGAASIQPVVTERTVVHLDDSQVGKKLIKWRRQMIESAKQCHTPFIPRLEDPQNFRSLCVDMEAGLKLLPSLSAKSRSLREVLPACPPASVAVLIGPEGDFSPEEELLAKKSGFLPVTLGPLILRAETASISMLAILGHEFRH